MSYDLIVYECVHKVSRGAFELHSRKKLILGQYLKLVKGDSLFGCASSLASFRPWLHWLRWYCGLCYKAGGSNSWASP